MTNPPRRRAPARHDIAAVILVAALTAMSAPGSTAAPHAAAQQRPAFRGTVTRVQVDAIVTDDEGNFIGDLRLEDFSLFEDGVRQEILDMQLVDLLEGSVDELGEHEGDFGSIGGPALLEPRTRAQHGGRFRRTIELGEDLGAMIFLIDGPSLELRSKARFANAWTDLIEQTDDLRVPRAVYAIDSVGTLEELTPLTLEPATLVEAVAAVREMPVFGTGQQSRLRELLDIMSQPQGIETARAVARGFEQQETARSLSILDLLIRFCDSLAARPGRTALVWVTTGAKTNVGGPSTVLTGGRDAQFTPYQPNALVRDRQEALHRAANSANVSIYSIDPTSRSNQRSMGFDVATRGAAAADLLGSFELQASLDDLRNSLRDAADATGGKAFVYWGDLARALADIEQDSSRFYLLTYAAPPPEGDAGYHEIRVEVNRPDLTVRERSGYVDLPDDQRRSRRISAALTLPGTVSGPPIAARAYRRWSASGEPIVQVVAAVEVESTEVDYTFHAVAVTEDGEVGDQVHQGVGLRIADGSEAGGPGADASSFIYDWPLPPATYSLRIVMDDAISGRLSAAELEVEVPEPGAEWRTSDLILAVSGGVGPARPLLTNRVALDSLIYLYVEVEGGGAPVLSGTVFGSDATTVLAQIPPTGLEVSAGIHRGAAVLRGMEAGDLVLQVTVTDPVSGRHRIFRESLTIVR